MKLLGQPEQDDYAPVGPTTKSLQNQRSSRRTALATELGVHRLLRKLAVSAKTRKRYTEIIKEFELTSLARVDKDPMRLVDEALEKRITAMFLEGLTMSLVNYLVAAVRS